MNSVVRIPLTPSPEQVQRLLALQRAFARVCNALAPVVQETRIWNRVALHHLTYRKLREAFPEMGSQMVCNAIYSVSRACRVVFQTPGSPFHHTKFTGRPLPRLNFSETCPVYFDRHTLSLKDGRASMYTLDGRMRFDLALSPGLEASFRGGKLQEVSLQRVAAAFELIFVFGQADETADHPTRPAQALPAGPEPAPAALPDYLCVEEIS
jgi:hypothetical protein